MPVAPDRPLAANAVAWAAGERFVLLDLDLVVRRGELLLISGHNGAGKTSLLSLLRGAQRPTRGSVTLAGVPLADVDPAFLASQIATLQHQPGLYFDLSGLENVQLLASLVGQPLSANEAHAILDQVGLPREAHTRRVRHYSRGMQQRTGLARIIASRAPIWLLDEPSTGLDSAGRATLARVLRDAVSGGAAVLAISHDPELLALADRRLELSDGRLHEVA